jgi:hypothetical protein
MLMRLFHSFSANYPLIVSVKYFKEEANKRRRRE